MASLTKTLFIGIDAADKDLVIEWARAGHLPNFRKLMDASAWTCTQSPEGLYVGAIWPSFYTGVSPARHGRYCYEQLQSGSYKIRRFSPREVKAPPFWEQMDRAGKRVAVIDVPKTCISKLENGIQIVDWGTHDPDPAGYSTCPESMAADILERFGGDSIHNCNGFRTNAREFMDFRDVLLDRIRRKTELDLNFLDKGGWDCFLTVFSECHCVGHQCWHLHDRQHRDFNQVLADETGDPVKEVYQAIDVAIGKLIDRVDHDTTVAVFASHGMGPHYDATFMLDDILRRLEGEKPDRVKPRLVPVVTSLWKLLPKALRKYAKPLRRKARVKLGMDKTSPSPAQLAKRKFFRIPNNDAYGGIRINLIGREPEGRITPGTEYDEICNALTKDLLELINLDTGKPLVKKVLRSTDLYQGDCLHYLPDLLVEWDHESPVSDVYSAKTGKISGEYKKCRTGDHKPEGLLLVRGPSISPGPLDQPVSVMDLAPTLAALAGIQLDCVDGQSITPLLGIPD